MTGQINYTFIQGLAVKGLDAVPELPRLLINQARRAEVVAEDHAQVSCLIQSKSRGLNFLFPDTN